MEWGSSYVYDYQRSSEEELSGSELEEGMWLSLSEGEDDEPPVPALSSKPPAQAREGGLLKRLFKRKPKPEKGTSTRYVTS